MRNEIIVVPVNSKRTTIIAGIAFDGTKLTPCIALANKRREIKLIINSKQKGFKTMSNRAHKPRKQFH